MKAFAISSFALILAGAIATAPAEAGSVRVAVPGVGDFQAPVTSLQAIPFRTVVRQEYDFSCGSAALATLLRHHYATDVSEADVMRQMFATGDQAKIAKLGFSLFDMKLYLQSRGIAADGYRVPLDVLEATQTPAITMITLRGYKHFVVVKGVRADMVLVGDPAAGLKAFPRKQFEKIWDGVVFVIREAQVQTPRPVFNSSAEWASLPTPPARAPFAAEPSLAALTRTLPPAYQLTPSQLSRAAGAGR